LREISAFLSGSEAVREKTGVLGPAFWDTVARKGKNSLVKMGASSFTSSRTTGCSSVFTTGRTRETVNNRCHIGAKINSAINVFFHKF